jgi:hypothetical protein
MENYHFTHKKHSRTKYSIKNVNCFNSSDTLVVIRNYSVPGVWYDEGTNLSIYEGCFDYEGGYTLVPMSWHYFEGFYRKNNVVTTFSDSVYIQPNGKSEWIFNY